MHGIIRVPPWGLLTKDIPFADWPRNWDTLSMTACAPKQGPDTS